MVTKVLSGKTFLLLMISHSITDLFLRIIKSNCVIYRCKNWVARGAMPQILQLLHRNYIFDIQINPVKQASVRGPPRLECFPTYAPDVIYMRMYGLADW